MDRKVLTQLKRSELQSLAKNNNIRATQSSAALIDELAALPHPNIGGVPALKQKMGKDALMRQKIMQRNGYAPPAGRGEPKPRDRQELPAKERAAAKRKSAGSKRVARALAGTTTDCVPEASSSKVSEKQLEDADAGQPSTSGPAHENDGVMDPAAQAELAPGHNVSSPALRRGNVVPEAGAQANDVPKELDVADAKSTGEQLGSPAEDDEDFRDEEEVEAMTSLENIVVELSSPARPEGCKGKRKAECDFAESPRPAKRMRSLRVA